MDLKSLLSSSREQRTILATRYVVPEPARCVQCGICSYYCPVGIDVRVHVWRNESITNSACLTCGECVVRCPRSVLRFEQTDLFKTRSG